MTLPGRRVRRPTRWRWIAVAAAAIVLLLLGMALDGSPAVPRAIAPTGTQVRDGRDALRRLRDTLRAPQPATVRFSDADLHGIAALAANVTSAWRVAAGLTAGRATAMASRELPLGLWLNLHVATVPDTGPGFPALDVSVGDIGIPRWLTRVVMGALRGMIVLRGAKLPPLDRLVLDTDVTGREVAFRLGTPIDGTGLVRLIVGLQAAEVDGARVASLYCGLVAAQRADPANDVATHLRRGVAAAPAGADAVAENRALLVALAMLTVGERAADLADDAAALSKKCWRDPPNLTLASRADLAKHWSLSAALGATVGGDATRALGEWKELSDSLPGGSGFSFVDLAADRAGLRIGRAAGTPAKAAAIRAAFVRATDAMLLPLDAASLAEGLTDAQFVARYGSIDTRDFDGAVTAIDALLDRDPVLRAAR